MKRCFGILIILSATSLLLADNLSLVYQDANIKELRGVFAMSNGVVWAVGTDGAVRKSTNNGDTWQTVTISGASDYHLNAVFFRDANNGFIVGEKKADPDRFKGKIYRTTNGGATWDASVTYTVEKYIPFKDVVFQIREGGNSNWGYIAAGEGWVYQTTNGGQNWFREPVDPTHKRCFNSVAFDLFNTNTIYAVGDAGDGTGIVAYNSGSGWVVEYPFSNLGLNYFSVTSLTANRPHIAASKGYKVYKDYQGQWTTSHVLPDENILYGIGAIVEFTSKFVYAGSDEAIFGRYSTVINHNYEKYIRDVSMARISGYGGPSILSNYSFLAGKDGRIFKYDPSFDPYPPGFVEVTGQSGRVKLVIFDSEDPSYAYIFRATIPEGPYILVDDFDIPANQNYTWYDYSVDYSINYYYKVSGDGQIPVSDPWVAQPYNLPLPTYPSPVSSFTASDYSNDNGARINNTWNGSLGEYVLYRDGLPIYIGNNTTFTDNAAITGTNHQYKVRTRAIVKETDYIYSSPVTCNCTPVNNLIPSAPTNLTGEMVGNGFKMRWNEPNNVDIHGYNIYRKINIGGNYTKVNSVPCPRPFWYDTPPAYQKIWFKVSAVDWAGNESGYSNEIYFDAASQPDGGTQGKDEVISETTIEKILPNPVNKNLLIKFSLKHEGIVNIDLYDATGRMVKNLARTTLLGGNHALKIDLNADDGIPDGVYFIRMKTDDYQAVEKLVVRR